MGFCDSIRFIMVTAAKVAYCCGMKFLKLEKEKKKKSWFFVYKALSWDILWRLLKVWNMRIRQCNLVCVCVHFFLFVKCEIFYFLQNFRNVFDIRIESNIFNVKWCRDQFDVSTLVYNSKNGNTLKLFN